MICGMGVPPVYLTGWKPVPRDERLDTHLWGAVLGPTPQSADNILLLDNSQRERYICDHPWLATIEQAGSQPRKDFLKWAGKRRGSSRSSTRFGRSLLKGLPMKVLNLTEYNS